jgi:serine/threonine-protein kinase
MGTVYLAEDVRLPGRQCAVKEMSPAHLAPSDHGWAVQAFRQEAQMLATLQHPGLTSVTDFFSEDGDWYLVMEYVIGETLETRIERAGGRLPLKETLNIARQLCDVLTYLHAQSPPVVFRDLKPGNVMLTPKGEVKLIDFGIARFFKPGQTRDTINLGTPGYAAPEQYGGLGQSDPRTDIYSLGALLHQMTTGYDPTMASTPFPLPPVEQLTRDVPRHIDIAISRATQLRPELRFRTIREMRHALFTAPLSPPPAAVQPPAPSRRGRQAFVIVGGLGFLAVVICGLALVFILGQAGGSQPAPTLAPTFRPQDTEVATAALPTETPEPPPSPAPTAGPSPAELEAALLSAIRYREDNDGVIFAYRVEGTPTIDGRLDEWTGGPHSVANVVHEDPAGSRSNAADLSGAFFIGWDSDNLYLGVEVTDDVHAQTEQGDALWQGDDVELQIDADLEGDFFDGELSNDDGQIGLSAGDFGSHQPEAYIWRPPALEQPGTAIDVAAQSFSGGYVLEAAVPWWTLGGRPAIETPAGFCLCLSDNDISGTAGQQSMVCTTSMRRWGDPTTWGTLILVDW